MQRACKVTLKFTTIAKRLKIQALLRRYRSAVNFFIDMVWTGLKPRHQDLTDSLLSARYRQAALKQAVIIVETLKKTPTENKSKPVFDGTAILDQRHVAIEEGKGHFDLAVRISSLDIGNRMTILTKKTEVLNKWLSAPGAKLIQGCGLTEDAIILWVKISDLPVKKTGETIAVDVGINKLLVDSDGNSYGIEWKKLSHKIRRKQPGSKARKRACEERINFINNAVNQLPWNVQFQRRSTFARPAQIHQS